MAIDSDQVLSVPADSWSQPGIATGRLSLLAVGIMFMVSWGIFVAASGRGFEIVDEGYYLIAISASGYYPSVLSEFGRIWHPLYDLTRGNIALFRIAGAGILLGCGTIFGFSVVRFAAGHTINRSDQVSVVIAILTVLLWQFEVWKPTPNYNELNCCGLLLFCSGLLFGSEREPADPRKRTAAFEGFGAPILAGIGLAVVALTKPTSGAAALCLALAWLYFVPPRAPFISAMIAALATTLIIGVFALDAYGSLGEFIRSKIFASKVDGGFDSSGGAFNGTVSSVTGILGFEKLWKFFPGTVYSLGIFLIAAAFYRALLLPGQQRRAMLATALAAVLLVVVATFRAGDVPGVTYGYFAWMLVPGLIPVALIAVAVWQNSVNLKSEKARKAIAAGLLLALMPLAFSVGTNTALLFHVGRAGVFWLAAAAMFGAALRSDYRSWALSATTVLYSAATLGMFLGVMITPQRQYHATPQYSLWRQSDLVSFGPDNAQLSLDVDSAEQIRAVQGAARRAGFGRNSPVLDLSSFQPSGPFILSGRSPGSLPPDYPDSDHKRKLLATANPAELHRSWVITGGGDELQQAESTLHAVGIDFPASYDRVTEVRRRDNGATQILWRPRPAG